MTRRRGALLAFVLLAAAGGAIWAWRAYTAPEPPIIDYAGADPDVADAIEAARLAVRANPRSAEDWGRYGMVLSAHFYADPAILCFEQAGRLDESNSRWPHLAALQYFNAGKVQQALPHLRRAISVATTRDERGLLLSILISGDLSLGDLDAAEAALRDLSKVEADSARYKFASASILIARGKPDEARPLLQSVANDPHVRKRACEMLAQTGDPAQRAAGLQFCKQLPPDEPWNNPHFLEMMKFQVQRRDPIGLFHQLQMQGRGEEALEHLEKLVAESPTAETTFLLGHEYLLRKKYRPAADSLRASLKLDSRNSRAHLDLASTLFALADYEAALSASKQALALDANLPTAHTLRGRAFKHLKRTPESLQEFREAVICQPESAELHRELGEELAEAGQIAEGIEQLENAIKLAPPNDPKYRAAYDKWKAKKK